MADNYDFLLDVPEPGATSAKVLEEQGNPYGFLLDVPQEQTPSFTEAGTAVGQGMTAGAVKGATTGTTAAAGAASGAAIGALTGPLAPVAVPVLGVVGFGVGAWAGNRAGEAIQENLAKVPLYPGSEQTLTFKNMESVPYNLRPYAAAGETFGGSVPFAAAPYVLSRAGIRFADDLAGRFLNGVIHSAERAPVKFAAQEATMAFGAAYGAGVAEAYAPGSPIARMGGEIVGGFLNPARTAIGVGTWATDKFHRIMRVMPGRIGEAAVESGASGYVNKLLQAYGEDPEQIIARLRLPDPVLANMPLTPGQKINSAALLALEHKLIQNSTEFGDDAKTMATEALTLLQNQIKVLSHSGDPQALKIAAELQDQYFATLLHNDMEKAANRVTDALAALKPDDPISRADFGRQINRVLDESTTAARAAEKELWAQVDGDLPMNVENITQRAGELRDRLLEVERLPKVVEDELAFWASKAEEAPGQPVTNVSRLLTFRSRMLKLSREAAADNKWSDASIYGALAEAALDDLTANADMVTGGAIDAARNFSRQFHETFSQTFAGDVLKRADEGGLRLPPELVAQRAFASGAELGELQFRQLAEAAAMAGEEQLSRMIKVQQDTLRFAANQLFIDGTVNATRLLKFRTNNRELLARFPELDEQLKDVQSAQKFFEDTQSQVKATQKSIKEDAAFAKLIGGEDPADAVGRVIQGQNPIMELGGMMTLARSADSQAGKPGTPFVNFSGGAESGMQSAVLNWLYDKAVDRQGDFSFAAYQQLLDRPVTPSAPPLKDVLVNAGVMKQDVADQILSFLTRAAELEAAMASGRRLDTVNLGDDMVFDTAARVIGAKLGAYTPGRHSLIAQAAGARLSRQVLDQLPQKKIKELITAMAKDPELMALILEKGGTYQIKQQRALQLNAFLLQAGLLTGWEEQQ